MLSKKELQILRRQYPIMYQPTRVKEYGYDSLKLTMTNEDGDIVGKLIASKFDDESDRVTDESWCDVKGAGK